MTTTDTHIDLPAGDTDTKPVLMLSVHNAKDRELIKKFLPDGLEIEVSMNGIADRPFDLCIMDHKSFHVNKDTLQQLKDEAAPIFLPFLLLSQNQDSVRKSEQILEFADDVVYVPASTKLLQSRINMLLKQREYSLKLEEKNRELARKNQELAEEKRKYQLITENATDMISRHRPDGTYLYVSPAAKELTGFEPEELVGRNAFENMHPNDRQALKQIEAPFAEGEVVTFSFRKQVKDGSYKWVETSMRAIRDESGDVTEIQASTRDISARKEYERKLKEEKEFIDKSIASLPELFFLLDEDQNFVRWNNVERELGYSDEEVSNMHPLEFYQEKDQPFIISKIRQAFEEGSAEAEVEMLAKSGELIPFFVTAKHFKRGDENYIVGSCINLSDIKEAQYELEQHRQLLDAIINQTEAIIYVKDRDGKIRLVNNSYLELFDLSREEVIGKTNRELFSKELIDNVKDNVKEVLEEGKTLTVEEQVPIDGKARYYHSIKYPLKDVPGFENCLCGISTEITDRKNALHKLQERIKEQRCLYNISSLAEHENSIDELLQEAVSYISEGFQHREDVDVAIRFNGSTYQTKGYSATSWSIQAESRDLEDAPLYISVAYPEEKESLELQEFLEEKQKLLDNIAVSLCSKVDRILAQRKLKQSERRWESLVQNDPDLIQLLLPDGTIKFINPSGAKMLGFESPEDVIGSNYFEIMDVSDEAFELTKERVQQVMEGEEIESQTYKITNAKGKELYLESKAVPITLSDGQRALQQVAEDVTDRVEYERELKKSLNEKETLLQEIHHRVKNNLAVVSGMMELQTFNTENEEVRSLLSDSKNRIKTMALIHEKLYRSESLSEIDFGSYVRDLAGSIAKMSPSAEDIDLEFDCDVFNLNINQAVPTALIINEIMSNAYEHAFGENEDGKIDISIKQEGKQITVRISDNGKGLPTDLEFRKGESIGFTIIETLVMQLEAELDITNENGLAISFSFEKQDIKGSASTLI